MKAVSTADTWLKKHMKQSFERAGLMSRYFERARLYSLRKKSFIFRFRVAPLSFFTSNRLYCC